MTHQGTPDLESALDGLQAAEAYCEDQGWDELAYEIADLYQQVGDCGMDDGCFPDDAGPDQGDEQMSDAELEAFKQAIGELGERMSEFLAEGTDDTAEEIEADVEEYSLPDPLEDEEIEALGQQIDEQREEIHEALAEDLGEVEPLTLEEFTELLAEVEGTTAEEIEHQADELEIAPPEEAKVVGYGEHDDSDDDAGTLNDHIEAHFERVRALLRQDRIATPMLQPPIKEDLIDDIEDQRVRALAWDLSSIATAHNHASDPLTPDLAREDQDTWIDAKTEIRLAQVCTLLEEAYEQLLDDVEEEIRQELDDTPDSDE